MGSVFMFYAISSTSAWVAQAEQKSSQESPLEMLWESLARSNHTAQISAQLTHAGVLLLLRRQR